MLQLRRRHGNFRECILSLKEVVLPKTGVVKWGPGGLKNMGQVSIKSLFFAASVCVSLRYSLARGEDLLTRSKSKRMNSKPETSVRKRVK